MRQNPRLAHLNRRTPGPEEPDQPQQTVIPQLPQYQRQQNPSLQVPRPIHPSINTIPIHDRFSLKANTFSYPPADSLFTSNVNFDAGPNFLRVTSGVICASAKKFSFPQSVWVMPLGSDNPIVPSITVKGPLRCTRCKAYVNPYFKIDATGSVFCNICGYRYTSSEKIDPTILNSTQLYTSGVIDFKVSDPLYIKKDPKKVKIMLLLEMTKSTIDKGLFQNIIGSIKTTVQSFAFDSGVRIGVAVFGVNTSFFKVRSLDKELIEYAVTDGKDSICPLAEKDLFYDTNDEQSKAKLIYLLDKLVERAEYLKAFQVQTNYYSAISCVMSSFGNNAGRIVLFSMNEPVAAPGRLRPREKQEIKMTLKPIHEEYVALAKQLVENRIGLDHFIFGREGHVQHELATTHFIATMTGGNLYHYLLFNPTYNEEHLHLSIYTNLTRQCAYDVDFACRFSNGLSATKYLTASGFHKDRHISLGILDASQSVSCWFEHEEKLSEVAYMQFAMMFTNTKSERIIRVINYKFMTSDRLEQIHQGCDYLAVASHICKEHANEIPNQPELQKVVEGMFGSIGLMLQHYRNETGNIKFSQLQIHPHLKNMLPYIHGVLSSCLFTNLMRNIPDSRIVELSKLNSISFQNFANRFYPKLYPIDLDIYDGEILPGDFIEQTDIGIIPPNLPLSATSIKQGSAYIANDSEYLYLFVMPMAPPDLLMELFGTENIQEVMQIGGFPQLQTGHNIRINNIIAQLKRRNSSFYLPLIVLTPSIKAIFDDRLINILREDNRERPYLTFLKQLHARIQAK